MQSDQSVSIVEMCACFLSNIYLFIIHLREKCVLRAFSSRPEAFVFVSDHIQFVVECLYLFGP